MHISMHIYKYAIYYKLCKIFGTRHMMSPEIKRLNETLSLQCRSRHRLPLAIRIWYYFLPTPKPCSSLSAPISQPPSSNMLHLCHFYRLSRLLIWIRASTTYPRIFSAPLFFPLWSFYSLCVVFYMHNYSFYGMSFSSLPHLCGKLSV